MHLQISQVKNSGKINLINNESLEVKLAHLETGFQTLLKLINEQFEVQIQNKKINFLARKETKSIFNPVDNRIFVIFNT